MNIRKYTILTFLILSIGQVFAQSAPLVGSKWTYIRSSLFGENGNYYNLQIALDTVIDGKMCKKMVGGYGCAGIPNKGEFVLFENKKAYRYDFTRHRFWLLYDWSANVGDIVTVYVPSVQQVDSFKIRIDSVITWTPNGAVLRIQKFSPIGTSKWLFGSRQIIEKLGANAFFFPQYTGCDPIQFGQIRCFDEPTQSLIKFVPYKCDTVIVRVRTSDVFKNYKIDLSPTPSVSDVFLTLDTPVEDGFTAEATNIIGQKVWSKVFINRETNIHIDINDWAYGMYILTLIDNKGGKWSRQFIKIN